MSHDYMEIVQSCRRGLWNVPYVSFVYLIKGSFIHNKDTRPTFAHEALKADLAFCKNLRENGHFIYVTNTIMWGHLVEAEKFSTSHLHNELWEIFDNRYNWEQRYLHPNYSQSFLKDAVIMNPCTDVYWFPFVHERFADELVEEMENYGRWSDGSNSVSQ